MEKIERLKIPKVKHEIGLRESDGSNLIELKMVGEKINEIIDHLNSQDQDGGYIKKSLVDIRPNWETEFSDKLMLYCDKHIDEEDLIDFIKRLMEEKFTNKRSLTADDLDSLVDELKERPLLDLTKQVNTGKRKKCKFCKNEIGYYTFAILNKEGKFEFCSELCRDTWAREQD